MAPDHITEMALVELSRLQRLSMGYDMAKLEAWNHDTFEAALTAAAHHGTMGTNAPQETPKCRSES